MNFITLAAISALCFLLASTRKFAVIDTGTLFYFQPYHTVAVLALTAIAFYFYRKHQRRHIE